MATWKLSRQISGDEEFTFSEGDKVTIGRGADNTITLSSIVISRNHCEVDIQKDEVLITDLKSSNGIYVGTKKIPQNIPYAVQHLDTIGFGWTTGARLTEINENEKFVFKLMKITDTPTLISRIKFQTENETFHNVEEKISILHNNHLQTNNTRISKQIADVSKQKIKIETKPQNICNSIIIIDDDIVNISDTDKEEEKSNQTAVPVKKIKLESKFESIKRYNNIINILSDRDKESCYQTTVTETKIKLEDNVDENQLLLQDQIKQINSNIEYEAFDVKQEYLAYDDDPIQIDSESDTESDNWILRLSQNSPGKPFTKTVQENRLSNIKQENCSYSQLDDYVDFEKNSIHDNKEEANNLCVIPSCFSSNAVDKKEVGHIIKNNILNFISDTNTSDFITINKSVPKECCESINFKEQVDGFNTEKIINQLDNGSTELSNEPKRTQMIDPLAQLQRRRNYGNVITEKKRKTRRSKIHKETRIKKLISSCEKESRKNKLKEIANKEKFSESNLNKRSSNNLNKSISNVKITSLNRGAFLSNVIHIVKPTKRKQDSEEIQKNKLNDDKFPMSVKDFNDHKNLEKEQTSLPKEINNSEEVSKIITKSACQPKELDSINTQELKVPLKNVKPIADTDDLNQTKKTILGKPFSKVVPLPPDKQTKKVRFSDAPPEVIVFEIEPGNKMNKTSLAKSFIENQFSRFSLEKLTLMKILRWNPHWLEEQINKNDPPPILGSTFTPTAKLHTYEDHNYYQQCFGDLLLMEIWECLTVAYMKTRNQNNTIQFRIESMPPVPPPEHCFDLFNISVNSLPNIPVDKSNWICPECKCATKKGGDTSSTPVRVHSTPVEATSQEIIVRKSKKFKSRFKEFTAKLSTIHDDKLSFIFSIKDRKEAINRSVSSPSSDSRNVPRVGDIILINFGPETMRNQRFFFVNNVRSLPSPPSNKNSFYSISLQATFTEKMQSLRTGELIIGKNLVYIKKELMLFEALEYLNTSPLCNVILCPKPHFFPRINRNPLLKNSLQWTIMLNSSQKIAVNASVTAALSDEPSVNMVQGPPGTGKSSVICAIIMSYFYDAQNKRQQNRGKILICATSNAAIDELVIRLLNIRQNLPRAERFRMVRVGRAEAMHPRALDVSSYQLALRDARSHLQAQSHRPVLSEEISHLEAKVNMWKTAAQDAKDPVRVAYCQTRIAQINSRIALVRTSLEGNVGVGGAVRADQLLQSERRIIEGADIIVTTLASAQNHKLKGLKERIALCIIDEAGQAIEPETLIPLTLGVKRLTLIGDPQQLPGYICSQRAKKHGLGESLFSRLASCMEHWTDDIPVILLQQQYRMHKEIADYPNRAFYDSKIETVIAPRPKLTIPPYLVISISSGDKGQGSSGANEIEAWGVARLVLSVNGLVNTLKLSLAVITPYNAHKDLIKKNLRILDPRLVNIEVNTVDSFQGQERDVVVVSLARSQGVGFLTDTGRMNVMLTRARHALIICLNPTAMLRNHQWRTLIEDAQRRNVYTMLPTNICQSKPISDDVLKYLQI